MNSESSAFPASPAGRRNPQSAIAKPLRVLIIEDSEDDALLLLRELRRGGYEPVSERVETADAMKAVLQKQKWDLIISDYVLPRFSGLAALEILKESRLDLPFIIVSGNIGEDVAVSAMKAGAHDYIIKGNLKRLIPAVERELRDAEVRRERGLLKELRKEREFIDAVLNNVEMLVVVLDPAGKILSFNRACEALSGYSFFEVRDRPFWDIFLPPGEVDTVKAVLNGLYAVGAPTRYDNYWLTKSGESRFIEWTNSVIGDSAGQVKYIVGTGIDATYRKQAEEALRRTKDELEVRVQERTAALARINQALGQEIRERKEKERHIKATNDLLKLFSQTFLKKEYLDEVAELIRTWCSCEGVGIRLLDEYGSISFGSFVGFSREFWEKENCLSIGKDQCVCPRVIAERPEKREAEYITPHGSFFCNDMTCFLSELEKEEHKHYRWTCSEQGVLSLAAIPIRYRDTVLGSIHVLDRNRDKLPRHLIEFIESISPMIGEALYRFYIEESLMNSREQLRNLSKHLQEVRESERTTIAREIHDELGQIITALRLELAWLRDKYKDHDVIFNKSKSMLALVDSTIQTIQNIIAELRPGILDVLGLFAAIEWQAGELKKMSGVTCDLMLPSEDVPLSTDISTNIFRIVQELFTNIVRYANATTVSVEIEIKGDRLFLSVTDNGVGIDPQKISSPVSFGILGIRERVYAMKGDIHIEGTPGLGTSVTITVPVHAGQDV